MPTAASFGPPPPHMLHCNKNVTAEYMEHNGVNSGAWRIVASAWAVVILFAVLFAAVQAVASLHGPSFHQEQLNGAVVPHHDPACAGPGIPNASASSDCSLSSGLLDRVGAEGYAGW